MANPDPSVPESVIAGALNSSAEDRLRRHLNPALGGEKWDTILHAIAAGDQGNLDLAIATFYQLFASSASGTYLDIQGSNQGIQRPLGVGISDANYRKYIAAFTNHKITLESVLE